MGWFIDERRQREIEEVLGRPLPPPTTEEFRALMQRLVVENPDLRQRILESLSASPVELPSERHERRLARQARLRRLLFGWLRRETFAGDVVWDKRRILASAFGAMAALLVAMFAVNQAAWQQPVAEEPGRKEASRSTASAGPPHPTSTVMPAAPDRTHLPAQTTPPIQPSTPSAPSQTPVAPVPTRSVPAVLPDHASGRPPVFPDLPPPPAWPSAPSPTEPQPAPATPRLIIQEAPQRSEPSRTLIVYQSQPAEASPAAGPPPQGAVVYDRGGQTTTATSPTPPPILSLRAGQMAAARLVTALALVPGAGAMPVVAASEGPALTWLGEATLGADGLVQITFHTAVGEQTALPVRAIAMDAASRRPGLEAQVKTVARNTAAAVVGAALRSTQDYVQALLQQRQVTITNGWATITSGEVPPFWMLLGSRLAELLAPRAQEASRPIQVAEIPAGAPLAILVLQAGGGR